MLIWHLQTYHCEQSETFFPYMDNKRADLNKVETVYFPRKWSSERHDRIQIYLSGSRRGSLSSKLSFHSQAHGDLVSWTIAALLLSQLLLMLDVKMLKRGWYPRSGFRNVMANGDRCSISAGCYRLWCLFEWSLLILLLLIEWNFSRPNNFKSLQPVYWTFSCYSLSFNSW